MCTKIFGSIVHLGRTPSENFGATEDLCQTVDETRNFSSWALWHHTVHFAVNYEWNAKCINLERLVGWLAVVTHHIQSGPRCGNSHSVLRDRQPYRICGELRRLPRRPPGNRTQAAGAEAWMHASVPTAPQPWKGTYETKSVKQPFGLRQE